MDSLRVTRSFITAIGTLSNSARRAVPKFLFVWSYVTPGKKKLNEENRILQRMLLFIFVQPFMIVHLISCDHLIEQVCHKIRNNNKHNTYLQRPCCMHCPLSYTLISDGSVTLPPQPLTQ